MATIRSRLKHAWNAFTGQNVNEEPPIITGGVSYPAGRYDRGRVGVSNERSILASILTRLSIDVAELDVWHVRLDKEGRFADTIDSDLQKCLTVEPNMDQGPRAFRQDIAMTILDKGCAAIVPVDTTTNPSVTDAFQIQTMRVGEIIDWRPAHVRVSLYNEAKGFRENLWLEKKHVAIVENPLYAVMNEPLTTLRRLIRKINLLDAADEKTNSGKLDLIIQLPYVVKSEARRKAASERLEEIEFQLRGSSHGIAYTDGTEKVIQLNRPVENTLLKQVEYWTGLLYAQLGLTPEVMNGTADEATMLNYHHRTIDPIASAIVEAMRRAFLTKTARSQQQSIMAFLNPLKFVPMSQIAEIADKLTRANVARPNDIRPAIGWKPLDDPLANKLGNPNMPTPSVAVQPQLTGVGGNSQNGSNGSRTGL